MNETFEQGWSARPFKEQFPELPDVVAARLDRLNHAITDMLLVGLITDSQVHAIRTKKFPKFVGEQISSARRKAITCASSRNRKGDAMKDLSEAAPQPPKLSDERILHHLDAILKASGSGLKNYSMHKTIEEMKHAVRAIEREILGE